MIDVAFLLPLLTDINYGLEVAFRLLSSNMLIVYSSNFLVSQLAFPALLAFLLKLMHYFTHYKHKRIVYLQRLDLYKCIFTHSRAWQQGKCKCLLTPLEIGTKQKEE